MLSSSEELSPIQSVISLVIGVALGLVFSLGVLLVEGWFEVSEDLEDEGVAAWLAEATEANLTGTVERARVDRREPRGFMILTDGGGG